MVTTYIMPSSVTEMLDNLEIKAETEIDAIKQAQHVFNDAIAASGLIKEETPHNQEQKA